MKKNFVLLISCCFLIAIAFLFFIILNREEYKINDLVIKNNRIVFSKDYKIKFPKKMIFDGEQKFLKVSDMNIDSGNLKVKQCILNIVDINNNGDICNYAANECFDLGCEKYTCEEYKNNFYLVRYFGNFVGSSDYELIKKNKNKTYDFNLDCENKDNDNINNSLFTDVVNNFYFNN